MRVRTREGKFAGRNTAIFRFCERTGLGADAYYEWAKKCGERASHNYKDRLLCEKYGLECIEDLNGYEPLYLNVEGMSPETVSDMVLERSVNPGEVAGCYVEALREWKDYEDKNDFIEANLSRFPRKSFERWSDVNRIKEVSGSWFDAKGIPLDVQAEVLSEAFYGEITIEDLVQHVLSYKKGKYVNTKRELIGRFKAKLEELCGFGVTESYAERLAGLIKSSEVVELTSQDPLNSGGVDDDDLPF